jgi:hypothetical protein
VGGRGARVGEGVPDHDRRHDDRAHHDVHDLHDDNRAHHDNPDNPEGEQASPPRTASLGDRRRGRSG